MNDLDVAVIDLDGGFGEFVVTLIRERTAGRATLHESVVTVERPIDAVVHCGGHEDPEGAVEDVVDRTPGTPVVLLIGTANEDVAGVAIEAGASLCLPRTPDVVRDVLVDVLGALVTAHRERAAGSEFELVELLHEVTHDLVGVQRAGTLEGLLLDHLVGRFTAATISRSDPETGSIDLRAFDGVDADAVPADRDANTADPTTTAHRTRLPAIAHDLQGSIAPHDIVRATDDPAERKSPAGASALGSALAVPLGHGGEFYGVLTVYATEPFAFTSRDVKLLLALGDAVARAYGSVEKTVALDSLTAEAERLRSILDVVGDAVFVVDRDGVVLDVNTTGVTVAGWPRQEIVGNASIDFLEMNRSRFEIELTAAFDGGTAQFETSARTADGHRPVEVSISALDDESAVAVVRDVTLQHDTERTLRRLREGVRTLLETEEPGAAATTAVRTLAEAIDVSAVVYLLDDETGALVPSGWTADVEGPDVVTEEQPVRWGAFDMNDERRIEARIAPTKADSVAIPLGGYGLMVTTATDDRMLGYARIVADDLTGALGELQAREALQRRSEALERHNQVLDEFAAVVSHDLRNPLGAAMGFLDLARETGDEGHFERVERAHDRMNDLITQLLELSRRDNRLDPERVLFADLREDARSAWSHVATESATLVVDDSRLVESDHDLLQELFENLFRNAVEHAGEGATVTVGVLPDGFYVEDDGPGIPSAIRDELATINRVTTDRGIGFGLSIVARIARAHEWDLAIGESGEGGARFEFTDATLREAEFDATV